MKFILILFAVILASCSVEVVAPIDYSLIDPGSLEELLRCGGRTCNVPGKIQIENYDELNHNEGNIQIKRLSNKSNDYYVGHIEGGEWLQYTLHVAYTTHYVIIVQGASAVETNGNLDILINNAYIGNIKFENTGNWQNWELFKLENIYIEKGIDQILQLNFNGTNFNINWIIFEKME
jgi:hypothetical protein